MAKVLKWSLLYMSVASLIELLNPYLIKNMIEWISKDDYDWQEGFGYAAGLGVVTGLKIYLFRRGGFLIGQNQVNSQAIVNHVVMNKVIKMSSSALGIVELGSITSLLSGDGMQLLVFNFYINTLIMVPFLVVCITAILVYEFGFICLVTPFVFMILIFVQYKGSQWCMKYVFGSRAKIYDQLGTYLSETIKGIKSIKFNGWEEICLEKIMGYRSAA